MEMCVMEMCVMEMCVMEICVYQVLEKIRPLDQKLHYQVDKLIRSTSTGVAG